MARIEREVDRGDGWCEWIHPVQTGYRLACCDCGLVHNVNFRVVRASDGQVLDEEECRAEFQVSRNPRSTGQIRRHMGKAP